MSETFHFSLVSPEREIYAGEVAHVVCPGTEGEFGVLPHHAPFMATLKTGVLRILGGTAEEKVFIRGGFADVTPAGLTVLAEEAIDLASLDPGQIAAELATAQATLDVAADAHNRDHAQAAVDRLTLIQAALKV
jgi:F-type H+-transporting ATPase subunit epsilon